MKSVLSIYFSEMPSKNSIEMLKNFDIVFYLFRVKDIFLFNNWALLFNLNRQFWLFEKPATWYQLENYACSRVVKLKFIWKGQVIFTAQLWFVYLGWSFIPHDVSSIWWRR